MATAGPASTRGYEGPAALPGAGDNPFDGPDADDLPDALVDAAPDEASAAVADADADASDAAAGDAGADAAVDQGVTDVGVRLTIYRGGDRLGDGTRVRRNRGVVEGEAVYTLARPAVAGERLQLLNFAEALREEPKALDTITLATYLDGPFERGRLDVQEVVGAAAYERRDDGERLEVELAAGATEVVVRYRVKVPHRYWPFGCARRRCSL
ncbi:MAG: hypothetical protein KC486_17780, partial [Myxococcales bacterium]|nr:hypothetical protein [Myxococcales bacterium]